MRVDSSHPWRPRSLERSQARAGCLRCGITAHVRGGCRIAKRCLPPLRLGGHPALNGQKQSSDSQGGPLGKGGGAHRLWWIRTRRQGRQHRPPARRNAEAPRSRVEPTCCAFTAQPKEGGGHARVCTHTAAVRRPVAVARWPPLQPSGHWAPCVASAACVASRAGCSVHRPRRSYGQPGYRSIRNAEFRAPHS
jgi:hypothetical protein